MAYVLPNEPFFFVYPSFVSPLLFFIPLHLILTIPKELVSFLKIVNGARSAWTVSKAPCQRLDTTRSICVLTADDIFVPAAGNVLAEPEFKFVLLFNESYGCISRAKAFGDHEPINTLDPWSSFAF